MKLRKCTVMYWKKNYHVLNVGLSTICKKHAVGQNKTITVSFTNKPVVVAWWMWWQLEQIQTQTLHSQVLDSDTFNALL